MSFHHKQYSNLIIFRLIPAITLFLGILSCENDIKTIQSFSNEKEIPVLSAENIEVLYSDSTKIKLRLVAPLIKKFEDKERPYTEFPNGIQLFLYKNNMEVKTIIKARYAQYFERDKLWYARNDVQANNIEKNEHLNTEELYWNETKGTLYSSKFTRIINANGVFYGENGFDADQNLDKWKLKGIKGSVKVKSTSNENKSP